MAVVSAGSPCYGGDKNTRTGELIGQVVVSMGGCLQVNPLGHLGFPQ
mgnify:CR=1 FL=1